MRKTLLILALSIAAAHANAQQQPKKNSAAVHRHSLATVVAGKIVEQGGSLYLVRATDGKSWLIRNPNRVTAPPGADVIVKAPSTNGNHVTIFTMRLGRPITR